MSRKTQRHTNCWRKHTKIKNKQQHKSTKELSRHLDDKCVPTPAQGGSRHSQRPRAPQNHRQPEARPRSWELHLGCWCSNDDTLLKTSSLKLTLKTSPTLHFFSLLFKKNCSSCWKTFSYTLEWKGNVEFNLNFNDLLDQHLLSYVRIVYLK